ncbi:MAG: MFS transporter [Synechococcales cyanobacterium RM1_1_8]|nr:MFS transporter [Synechococcales cyanobacterium RM1_1_8]
MGTFIRIWSGQLVSTIGSYMTVFALMIWVWNVTESATTLALVSFFSQLPRIFVTPVAGIIVDRFPRKHLILMGDVVAAICTVGIALLYRADSLELWHLYTAVAIYGCFGQLQTLSYSTSIALLVDKENYTRAESMVAGVNYSGAIFSPILAGILYPRIGLEGIFAIDLLTFSMAFITLAASAIPQPPPDAEPTGSQTFWQDVSFGFRYIARSPSLITMVVAFSLFAIPSDIGKALYSPMILARSGGDAAILGSVTTAAGVGGVLGAILLSIQGGFKRRINGMLAGFLWTGSFKLILGMSQSPIIWMLAHFAATLTIPLYYSSTNAIWYAQVPPSLQGRVLAADQMIGLIVGATAPLLAGPLADYIFEPAMARNGWLSQWTLGLWGSGPGAGIGFLYSASALAMTLVGVVGFGLPRLRQVEDAPTHLKL